MKHALRSAAAVLAVLVSAAAAAAQTYFEQAVLHETRLVMDAGDWRALRDNFATNQYYAANISIDGVVVQQVGIRSRGKGSRSGTKPGLRVDFNRYVTGQQLQGRKAIILDNLVQDSTFLKEALSYDAFESVGIAAPKLAYTRLTVNDEYWGLYTIVEEVSKPFLASRLGEDGGNLFGWEYPGVYDFSVRGSGASAYVPLPFEPETNEDSLDASGLVEFVRAINETPEGPGYAAAIGRYVDVPRFLQHVAVENAIAENDGIVGFEGMNNFYLYQYAGQNRFVFIPWDKDTTFVASSQPILNRMETNVLTRRLMADPEQQAAYKQAVKRVVQASVNARVLGAKAEQLYRLIREAALLDTKKPASNEAFEGGIEALKAIIAGREADVNSQVP
jgi:spore coat protein CotH